MVADQNKAILVVEDSEDDYHAITRSFARSGLRNPVFRCGSGDEALEFLLQRGAFESAPRPGVVLLDLNLPGMDGRQILRAIKMMKRLQDIPVVVLSSSEDAADIQRCYDEGANTFIHKPVDTDAFLEAVSRLTSYWLEVAVLPGSRP